MQRIVLTCALTLGLTPCLMAAPKGEDWYQWRGPNRDGISAETGLLREWPAGGPALVWKAIGLGGGYSGVSLQGDRLFTMGEKADSSFVLAIDPTSGKILWSTQVGRSGAPGWGGFSGPRSTPTADGELVYALGQYGELVCVEAATGKERWRRDYSKDFDAPLPEWGFSESVLVAGSNVLCTPGGPQGSVAALDKLTGQVRWQTKDLTDSAAYASLIEVEFGGARQFIVLTPQHVAGFAAEEGRTLWRAEREGRTAVISTPIFRNGLLYVTSGYGVGCNLFRVSAEDSTFGAKPEYANKVMVNHHGGVVLIGDHLYGYSEGKGWVCQDLKSGDMVWNEKGKLGKGSLAYADGHLYLRAESDAGTVALIEATPEGYREKGRMDQPDRSQKNSWPHPVIAGGRLYLRDQDILLCYDVKAKK